MTSQESIGSCSLDVEKTASDRSEIAVAVKSESLSEKTLNSLDCSDPDEANFNESTNNKKPSYLSLACSINGYSGITAYNSKLRGLNSRDTSPGSRISSTPLRSNLTSPLIMERRNNICNGDQGYSEVDKGLTVNSHNSEISPQLNRSKQNNYHNKSLSPSISLDVSNSSFNKSGVLNGSTDDSYFNISSDSEKSFIQQRVERLYGPGALAQGFFRRSNKKLNLSNASNKSLNGNSTFSDDDCFEESLKNFPVLRHLRPEFRAQLPVISPRKPIENTEQVSKSLNRLSLDPVKSINKKETPKENHKTNNDSVMSNSTTSITDQQPAAPKVVLPVLETNSDSSSVNKENSDPVKESTEKNGHYFMDLLNKERNRLLELADMAETELSLNLATLPEEAAGKLRSAGGKARLLATQKMKQFEGLCQKNINQIPGEKFPTTSEDLEGFWDMVMLQVVQVNNLFDQLDNSRKAEWKDVEVIMNSKTPCKNNTSKKLRTPASRTKTTQNSESIRKNREAREETRRQLIEERRRAMRSNTNKTNNSIEIFVPET